MQKEQDLDPARMLFIFVSACITVAKTGKRRGYVCDHRVCG